MKARIASALAVVTVAALSHAYDYNGAPVGSWLTLHNTAQIKQSISDGWRPTSVEVEGTIGSLGLYRVNYIRNTGSHYMQCRFEGEQTSAQINAVRSAGWRVEDVAVVGSKLSGLFIRNVNNPRTTLYFWGWTSSEIQTWLGNNTSYRPLDLDRYSTSNGTRYSGVFLRNVGDAYVSGWGWHPSMTWEQVGNWASTNGMRVIDLDRHTNGNYAVVFVKRLSGQRYFYFGNRTMSQVLDFLGNRGLRVQTISHTAQDGTNRYSGTAVNNVNAQSARLADYAANLHDGVQGFYVQEMGGSKFVDIHASRSMHPSSTIKVLLHFTGVYNTPTNNLGTRLLGGFIPMQTVHSKMMWNSDNAMANLCLDTYGEVYSETVGRSVCGMSTVTNFRNRFGTGGPYGNDEVTTTTLVDLGKVYSTVENGYFNATKDTWFRSNMLNQTNSGAFNNVITSVRNQLGITNTKYNDWLSRVRFILKAGSNSEDGVTGYWSIAGALRLPHKSNAGVATKKFLFGHYVNKSTINYSGWNAAAESVREQIKASMNTFK